MRRRRIGGRKNLWRQDAIVHPQFHMLRSAGDIFRNAQSGRGAWSFCRHLRNIAECHSSYCYAGEELHSEQTMWLVILWTIRMSIEMANRGSRVWPAELGVPPASPLKRKIPSYLQTSLKRHIFSNEPLKKKWLDEVCRFWAPRTKVKSRTTCSLIVR